MAQDVLEGADGGGTVPVEMIPRTDAGTVAAARPSEAGFALDRDRLLRPDGALARELYACPDEGKAAHAVLHGRQIGREEQETQTRVHSLPENWRETVGSRQPFGRLLMPKDPAALVAFLVSDDAAMMTGAIIDLDQFVVGTVDDNPGSGIGAADSGIA